MFDKEYSFRGKHAELVSMLTAQFSKNKAVLFSRNVDVYLIAPIIGFLFSRKAEIDKGEATTKIFLEQITNNSLRLWLNYRLIMLLDVIYEPDMQKRIDKAFRDYSSPKAHDDEMLYEQYVLGGVEILFEKLMESSSKEEDYFTNVYNFLDDVNDRYNKDINTEAVIDLCRLARG